MATLPVLSIEGIVIATAITCYVAWGIYALITHPEWIVVPPMGWMRESWATDFGCWISLIALLLFLVLTLAWILIAPLILLVSLPFTTIADRRADKKREAVYDRELEKPDYLNHEEDSE